MCPPQLSVGEFVTAAVDNINWSQSKFYYSNIIISWSRHISLSELIADTIPIQNEITNSINGSNGEKNMKEGGVGFLVRDNIKNLTTDIQNRNDIYTDIKTSID